GVDAEQAERFVHGRPRYRSTAPLPTETDARRNRRRGVTPRRVRWSRTVAAGHRGRTGGTRSAGRRATTVDMGSPEFWRWVWLVAAAVFTLGEMAVAGSFFLAPFAIGAAVAAILAFAG